MSGDAEVDVAHSHPLFLLPELLCILLTSSSSSESKRGEGLGMWLRICIVQNSTLAPSAAFPAVHCRRTAGWLRDLYTAYNTLLGIVSLNTHTHTHTIVIITTFSAFCPTVLNTGFTWLEIRSRFVLLVFGNRYSALNLCQ